MKDRVHDILAMAMSAPDDTVAPTLDRTLVAAVVLRELDRALVHYPRWVHPFAGLEFNRARRTYGQAHRDGRVVLSTLFLGTRALADLEDTIRHEFAHLVVGIDERHGPRWKQVAQRLGAVPRAAGRSRAADLHARMEDAPFTLVAVLASGEERALKPAFRRSRRFLDYRRDGRGRRYLVDGEVVAYFRYDRRET